MDDSPTPFSFGVRLGIYFTIQSACLSAASVLLILGLRLRRWRKGTRTTSTDASDSGLFLNLMLADLIQAIGTLPNVVWMRQGMVSPGPLCTAQAAVKQVGIVGVALTYAIAVHTFLILVVRWRAPSNMSQYAIAIIWLCAALILVIPNGIHRKGGYYGPTGFWCWIDAQYPTERIVTEYLWVWFSAFSLILLYGAMFMVMRGWVIVDDGIHWYSNYQERSDDTHRHTESEEVKRTKAIANSMLYYPLVYIVCIFPNTISRWLSFRGTTVSYQFILFSNSLFALSGLFNLVLFFFTRPRLVIGQPLNGDDRNSQVQIILQDHPSPGERTATHSRKFGYLADLRTPSPSLAVQQSNGHRDLRQSPPGTLTLVESTTSPLPGDSTSTLQHTDSKAPILIRASGSTEPRPSVQQEDDGHGYLPP
ncbi:hypothetical protein BJ165DRAFT_1341851 [Panaeolus papilionaceus]|nr:hypothetical protein BJ165DRAFT_1341851 [Panaeolus papilionaceus]